MTETNEKRQTGYIYSIRSYQTELIYIGSTFGTLRQRLYKHKHNFKQFNLQKYHYTTSYEIVKYDDAYVELVKTYENVNKMELHRFEGEHIRKIKCVNIQIAGQTDKEYYENNKAKLKEYREINKDKIKDKIKQYYEINKDKIQQQHKRYYADNIEKIKQHDKRYYADNIEKIKQRDKQYKEKNKDKRREYAKEYGKEKYTCACGKSLSKEVINQGMIKYARL